MYFASPLPWWLALLAIAGIVALAASVYRRPLAPLTAVQRGVLVALRALALLAVLFFVCRPVLLLPPMASGDVVVPVLVDVSRSMRIADADGGTRIANATTIARDALRLLSASATVDLFSFSDQVAPTTVDALAATGRTTSITAALDAVRARYRGRRVGGILLISDGGETASAAAGLTVAGPPVFVVGIGSPDGLPDREVTGVTAGDPRLDQASIDMRVTALSRGYGREPFQLRVLANGQVVDTRRVVPIADGAPLDETFTMFPDPLQASVYTAEIATEPGEAVTENNARSLVVSPAGRRRRVLTLAGAPGYEHSFLIRALQHDPGLEVDWVVRKGKNAENQDTFMVQAGGDRASTLTLGFPATREALFRYDALIIANIEGDFFTRAQLEMAAEFVGERGGGLLVLGARSFERRGVMGTALEAVLPVELTDRRGGALRAASGQEGSMAHDTLALTEEGARHPVMRIGASPEDSRRLWATLPALASSAALGGPRPGASVLAVTMSASGGLLPVVAVQRYGRGRSMIFAGEASWRWRMMLPAADRRHEFFWRQAARWLSTDAPDPLSVTLSPSVDVGDPLTVEIVTRDGTFAPVDGAVVEATLTSPAGGASPLALRPSGRGRFAATGPLAAPGLYRLHVEARQNSASRGTDDRWFLVSDNEREFADPRLNEGLLRRVARESGGRYVRAADASQVVAALASAAPQNAEPQRRDLWHEPWAFALVLLLLSAEWLMRRVWGLR